MTSWLIGSGLSDRTSCPVRTKVEFCWSRDHFGFLVTDCSTRPEALRVTTHCQQVASLIGFLTLCRGAVEVFYGPSLLGRLMMDRNSWKREKCQYYCMVAQLGITKRFEKELDGNYIMLLCAIWKRSWKHQPTKQLLYGHLPPILQTIQIRQARHARLCRTNGRTHK